MKSLCSLVWHVLLVLSIGLLAKSESQVRHCESLGKATELCQWDQNDSEQENSLKKWRTQRAETIKTLKDVREKLDAVCVGANYGKGAGNGAQIVGSVASIVGSLMELAGLPSFKSIMGVGGLVYHSGSLVGGVSSIAESLGSAKYLNDADNVLQKDKELSTSLGNLLDAWKSLDEKILELFDFDLTSEKRFQLGIVLHEFSRIKSVTGDIKKTIDSINSGKYSTYIATEIRSDRFLKLCSFLENNPQIPAGIRMGLITVNRGSGFVESYRKLAGKEISDKMSSVPQKYKAPTVNAVAKYTFLRSIEVAVNYMSLLDVAKIIKEGKSKYSNSLKEIIEILELELKTMEDL